MKNQFISFGIVLLCLLTIFVAQNVWADDPATPATPPATTPADPVPAPPPRAEITVQQLSTIEFGAFASDAGGGSVTVSPSGARTLSGNISPLNSGTTSAAQFEIIGEPGAMVVIDLPEQLTLANNSGRGEASITNLTVSPSDTLTLDQNGRARASIGATLQAPDNIVPGSYGGNLDLNVRYLN